VGEESRLKGGRVGPVALEYTKFFPLWESNIGQPSRGTDTTPTELPYSLIYVTEKKLKELGIRKVSSRS
jgi:hypothetical protein